MNITTSSSDHLIDSHPVSFDPDLWRQLTEHRGRESFCDGWIKLQATLMPGATRAIVLDHEPGEEEFLVVTTWPNQDISQDDLVKAAGEAISDGQPLVMNGQSGDISAREVLLAYPLTIDGAVRSVAVFAIQSGAEHALRDAMTRLQWGSAWLEVLYQRRRSALSDQTMEQLRTLMDLVAVTTEQGRYEAAASAMVTELAARLGCERVSYAEYRGRRNRVKTLSHSGQFGRQMNLINNIGRAMDEAVDQRLVVVYPNADKNSGVITRFQAELVKQHGSEKVVTVPMYVQDRPVGALCFEFSASTEVQESLIELCDTIGALLAPMLNDKRTIGRNILVKNLYGLRDLGGRLLGPKHLVFKLVILAAVAAGFYLYQATGSYKISADAALEGAVQRVVAVPFDGYVAASYRRAGDQVGEGEILGELDDRDLKLELIQLVSERAQAAGQYREAQAAHERARTKIFKARIEQADARIKLVRERIERTRLKAPFPGIVVSGDLSQSLGAAVERGEVLFEVAPLDDYRIILRVDERDIDYVQIGQPVLLVLSALANQTIETIVNKVTPVSTAADGRNYFRVEAHYKATGTRLRPGMEGVAKIEIDERPLIWIWTRELVDWVRLWLWRWLS